MKLRSCISPFFKSMLALAAMLASLQAAPPLFPGAGGDYGGVLEAASGGDPDNSGLLTIGLRDSGSATLKLAWQGQIYSLKASFTEEAELTRELPKKGAPAGTKLTLFCSLDPDTRTITGTLTDPIADEGSPLDTDFTLSGEVPDPAVTAQLDPGLRMAFVDPLVTTAAAEGAPENGGSSELTEDAFSLVTVGKTARRSSRFVGNLPDATKYSAGSPLRGAQYALRAGLYAQRKAANGGQLLGRGDVAGGSMAPSEARGPRGLGGSVASLIASFRWHKKKNGQIKTKAFPNGLDQRVDLDTVTYTADRDFSYVLTGQRNVQRNATMRLSSGNLGTRADGKAPGPNPISVGLNVTIFGAKIIGPNPYKVKLSVNPRAAKFSGSFKHPDTDEVMKFNGAFQSFFGVVPGQGRGNFLSLGPNPGRNVPRDPAAAQSGSVRITVN